MAETLEDKRYPKPGATPTPTPTPHLATLAHLLKLRKLQLL
jgi:hypothetical protein